MCYKCVLQYQCFVVVELDTSGGLLPLAEYQIRANVDNKLIAMCTKIVRQIPPCLNLARP
jgi:hypothetical protein